MATFRLIQGRHDHDGVRYTAGQNVQTALPLDTMFPGRFERISEADLLPIPAAPVPVNLGAAVAGGGSGATDDADESGTGPDGPSADPRGTDVTAQFKDAVAKDYLVFKANGMYAIFDHEQIVRGGQGQGKPLTTKTQVAHELQDLD